MLIEFLILLQVAVLILFGYSYHRMNWELFALSTILFAIIGFSYYNIEITETVPSIINTTTDIVTIEYEKVTSVYSSVPLFWVNILGAIISFIAGAAVVFMRPFEE